MRIIQGAYRFERTKLAVGLDLESSSVCIFPVWALPFLQSYFILFRICWPDVKWISDGIRITFLDGSMCWGHETDEKSNPEMSDSFESFMQSPFHPRH